MDPRLSPHQTLMANTTESETPPLRDPSLCIHPIGIVLEICPLKLRSEIT